MVNMKNAGTGTADKFIIVGYDKNHFSHSRELLD